MMDDDQNQEATFPAETSAGSSEVSSDPSREAAPKATDVAASPPALAAAGASGRRPAPASQAPAVPAKAPDKLPETRVDKVERAEKPEKTERVEKKRTKTSGGSKPNMVRRIRIERMMSKAELARSANLSVLTIDRVEKGFGCRVDTKRKILEALGLSLADRVRVFGEEE
jgi:ribosome-binding protein aMBF1 (putative translation factor)